MDSGKETYPSEQMCNRVAHWVNESFHSGCRTMTILEEPYEGDCSDDYSDDYNSPYRVANIFVKNVGHSFTGSDE